MVLGYRRKGGVLRTNDSSLTAASSSDLLLTRMPMMPIHTHGVFENE